MGLVKKKKLEKKIGRGRERETRVRGKDSDRDRQRDKWEKTGSQKHRNLCTEQPYVLLCVSHLAKSPSLHFLTYKIDTIALFQ